MKIGAFLAAAGVAAAVGIGFARAAAKRRRMEEEQQRAARERDILTGGLRRHAALYDGLYEGLYCASRGSANRDALREWCIRTEGLEGDAPFSRAFAARFAGSADRAEEGYQASLRALLALLDAAGVRRGEETEAVMDPRVRRAYIYLGTPVPEDGVRCAVMKPAWTCGGQLVEQGILTAKEE